MDNVIEFRPADEIEVKVDLSNVTLEDVLEAMYEKYDMTECAIVWREQDGVTRCASESEFDSYMLLCDYIDGK